MYSIIMYALLVCSKSYGYYSHCYCTICNVIFVMRDHVFILNQNMYRTFRVGDLYPLISTSAIPHGGLGCAGCCSSYGLGMCVPALTWKGMATVLVFGATYVHRQNYNVPKWLRNMQWEFFFRMCLLFLLLHRLNIKSAGSF